MIQPGASPSHLAFGNQPVAQAPAFQNQMNLQPGFQPQQHGFQPPPTG